jgi:ABC-type lipoprotein export system ATPase subunit
MKILSFKVDGLLGHDVSASLNPDLNILTGRNGAGKTSLLKLLWYIVSGNILLALQEVIFQRATIVTDLYECTLIRLSRTTCKVEFMADGQTVLFEDETDPDGDVFSNAEDEANPELIKRGSSVFFPTFRRIEGGFSLDTILTPPSTAPLNLRASRGKNAVEEALVALSRKLTNGNHIFVTAISTVDIVGLLLRQYADLSEVSNKLQQATSQEIIERIKGFKQEEPRQTVDDTEAQQRLNDAVTVLDEISSRIGAMEVNRERIMTPIATIQNLVKSLIRQSGIKFDQRLSFGDAANAVNSDALSAGEKQMLSFICYNAFYKNSVVFIDEPELSLHVDWQRQLFSILQNQGSSNQFIIATHSPFIYSKYPDKELLLSTDRGDHESELNAAL